MQRIQFLLITTLVCFGVVAAQNTTEPMSSPPVGPSVADINAGDTAWLMLSAALVMFMTPGLAFFYGGLTENTTIINTLSMSFVTIGIVTMEWVLVGYSFAFSGGNPFWGDFSFGALLGVDMVPNPLYGATVPHLAYCIFQMAFAIITPAIVSGAVVHRMKFTSYVLFTFLWALIVYNPIAHWIWSAYTDQDGNLAFGYLRAWGILDFAGGLVVHMSSGFSALIASIILGPRSTHPKKETAENIPLTLLGTGILWFGWFGFNAGSAITAGGLASQALMNTQVCPATSLMTWLFLDWVIKKKASLTGACSGVLVGLVVITPAAGYVSSYMALVMGVIGVGIVYGFLEARHKIKKLDDTLDVFVCHGIGGWVGAILTGLFADPVASGGLGTGSAFGNGPQIGWQLVGTVFAALWACGLTAAIMFFIKYTVGLKVSDENQSNIDNRLHGEVFVAGKNAIKMSERSDADLLNNRSGNGDV